MREGGGVERAREREAELKNESKDFISILFDEREFKRDKDKIKETDKTRNRWTARRKTLAR